MALDDGIVRNGAVSTKDNSKRIGLTVMAGSSTQAVPIMKDFGTRASSTE